MLGELVFGLLIGLSALWSAFTYGKLRGFEEGVDYEREEQTKRGIYRVPKTRIAP